MTRRLIAPLAAASLVLALAACAAPADDGRLSIVTSTDVYGDIAATIAGDGAEVTSIISGAAQDPHSYEASARDQLAVADADLVIVNGGGYDAFMATLLDASGSPAVVLDAVELSGLAPEDDGHEEDEAGDDHHHLEGFNEHVWYSFEAVDALAGDLADALGDLDPANASTYAANYERFAEGLAALEERAHELHLRFEGSGVAVTEPVPLYLLAELGFDNLTPKAFSEAVEEDADVPPLALDETLALLADRRVALLAYNAQTASPETERVRAAAEAAGVPVVDFTETLPDGADYLSWMTLNVEAVASALS